MRMIDGKAYPDDLAPVLGVLSVRPLGGYRLRVRFTTGEVKVVDLSPYLDMPVFAPLKEEAAFNGAYVDFGVVTWADGAIDISTDALYEDGVAEGDASA